MDSKLRLKNFSERLLKFKETVVNIAKKVDDAVTDCKTVECNLIPDYEAEKSELFDCEEQLKEKLHNIQSNLEKNFNYLYEEIAIMLSTHLAIDHLHQHAQQEQQQLVQQQLRQQQQQLWQQQQQLVHQQQQDSDSDSDVIIVNEIIADRTTAVLNDSNIEIDDEIVCQFFEDNWSGDDSVSEISPRTEQQQDSDVIIVNDSNMEIDDGIVHQFFEDNWLGDDSASEISPRTVPAKSHEIVAENDELSESDMVIVRRILENDDDDDDDLSGDNYYWPGDECPEINLLTDDDININMNNVNMDNVNYSSSSSDSDSDSVCQTQYGQLYYDINNIHDEGYRQIVLDWQNEALESLFHNNNN